jgi:hypothetical protein
VSLFAITQSLLTQDVTRDHEIVPDLIRFLLASFPDTFPQVWLLQRDTSLNPGMGISLALVTFVSQTLGIESSFESFRSVLPYIVASLSVFVIMSAIEVTVNIYNVPSRVVENPLCRNVQGVVHFPACLSGFTVESVTQMP